MIFYIYQNMSEKKKRRIREGGWGGG